MVELICKNPKCGKAFTHNRRKAYCDEACRVSRQYDAVHRPLSDTAVIDGDTVTCKIWNKGKYFEIKIDRDVYERPDVKDHIWHTSKGIVYRSEPDGIRYRLAAIILGIGYGEHVKFLSGDHLDLRRTNLVRRKRTRTKTVRPAVPWTPGTEAVVDGDICRLSIVCHHGPQRGQRVVTQFDTADLPEVRKHSYVARTFNTRTDDYYVVMNRTRGEYEDGLEANLHRFIVSLRQDIPEGHVIDHINGDTLDNRSANLRVCTVPQNIRNRKRVNKNNKTGVLGVGIDRRTGKYFAYVGSVASGGQQRYGPFDTIEEAAHERRRAEIERYGEFAPRQQVIGEPMMKFDPIQPNPKVSDETRRKLSLLAKQAWARRKGAVA